MSFVMASKTVIGEKFNKVYVRHAQTVKQC